MNIEKYTKKNGTTAYRFRIYVGRQNGKDKYIKRSGFKTKGQARNAILTILDQIEDEKENKPATFGQVAKEWLDEYYDTVQESTYIKTERMVNRHLLPELENKKISDITSLQLQEILKNRLKQLKNGRKLKGLLSNIFKYAIRHGYTTSNPIESVSIVQKRQTDQNTNDFYNKEELKHFLDLLDQTKDIKKICLFRLLAFTGIRKGELMALNWSDWIDNTLTINKAVTRSFGGLEIGLPKTASSKRLISLDKRTVEILKDYQSSLDTTKDGLIFQTDSGGIISPTLPRKWLYQILKDQDLKPIKIHGFRHTHASLCFEAGMTLKQVQYRLGHSDLKTTMNVYTHITRQAKDDIGERFSQYIDF